MIIKHNVQNHIDVVALRGQLTMASAAEARAGLQDIIEQGGNKLVIDFGEVDFVDSSGLSVLVSAYKVIDRKGGRVVLSNLRDNVQALFALTRLNEAFQVFASTQSALDHLGEGD